MHAQVHLQNHPLQISYLEDGLLVDGQHSGKCVNASLGGLVSHEGRELHEALGVGLQVLLALQPRLQVLHEGRWEYALGVALTLHVLEHLCGRVASITTTYN